MPAPRLLLPGHPRDIALIASRCRVMVRTRAIASATVALVPIPGIDMAVDVALLMRMIERINGEFGLTPEQIDRLDARSKMLLYQSVANFGSSMIGKAVTRELALRVIQSVGIRLASKSLSRIVPLAGQALSATLSFAAVRYVGERHVRDCVHVLEYVARD